MNANGNCQATAHARQRTLQRMRSGLTSLRSIQWCGREVPRMYVWCSAHDPNSVNFG
jgi:hypothetical protein